MNSSPEYVKALIAKQELIKISRITIAITISSFLKNIINAMTIQRRIKSTLKL